MKKIYLSVFIFIIFIFGFRGCIFDVSSLAEYLSSLESGFIYNKGDGIIDLFYVTAGSNGKIFTNDDPVHNVWTERSSGTSNDLNDLKILNSSDTGIVYAVGNNGTIIRSIDKGISWVSLNSPSNSNLNSVGIIDVSRIIAVGDSGVIIRTTNSGINWSQSLSGTTKKLNSVFSPNSFQTLVVGDDGVILRSTNSGLNWINNSLPDSVSDLNKVGYAGTWFFGTIAAIAGQNGKMYISTNFAFWNPVNTFTNTNIRNFTFKSASSGYIMGDSGFINYTTNGGVSWNSEFFLSSLTEENINSSIIINDSTFGGIAGGSFIIFSASESLLPVELSSFTSSVFQNTVTLVWTTSSEINNSGFEIERSNGNDVWIKSGFVNGNGNSEESHQYSFTDKNLSGGKYNYRLKQIDFNGNYEYFNLNNEIQIKSPDNYYLAQNYPNPFNPVTKIDFRIPENGNVKLEIYNTEGKLISRLLNEFKNSGYYSVNFEGSNLSSGVYFYRLDFQSEGLQQSKIMKMILLK